jgi:hypothetical protein
VRYGGQHLPLYQKIVGLSLGMEQGLGTLHLRRAPNVCGLIVAIVVCILEYVENKFP